MSANRVSMTAPMSSSPSKAAQTSYWKIPLSAVPAGMFAAPPTVKIGESATARPPRTKPEQGVSRLVGALLQRARRRSGAGCVHGMSRAQRLWEPDAEQLRIRS